MTLARVLTIAGSDSGGGAGIQADIKTVQALGGYGASAITALTAQNTRQVRAIEPVSPRFVVAQIEAVLEDIGADCIKTGMLHDAAVIEAVAAALRRLAPAVPLVVDPVMVAQSGGRLLQPAAVSALCRELLPQATLITPNLPEAEALLEEPVAGAEAMLAAARRLQQRYGAAVLLKGGHMAGDELIDVLVSGQGEQVFRAQRIVTRNNHGTGCTLASAIATGLAQGLELVEAVGRGRAYLHTALLTAADLGGGHGPVNHGHTVQPFPVPTIPDRT